MKQGLVPPKAQGSRLLRGFTERTMRQANTEVKASKRTQLTNSPGMAKQTPVASEVSGC